MIETEGQPWTRVLFIRNYRFRYRWTKLILTKLRVFDRRRILCGHPPVLGQCQL